MTDARLQAINRIRKLLAVARDKGASVGEVANALAAARKLMEAHAVSEAEANADRSEDDIIGDYVCQDVYSRVGRIPVYDRHLGMASAEVCCVGFATSTSLDGRHWGAFYGGPRDAAIAAALWKELRSTLRSSARHRYGARWRSSHTSYAHGFSVTVLDRAISLSDDAGDANPVAALLIRRQERLCRYEEQLGILPAKKGRTIQLQSLSAYAVGSHDGRAVSLNTNTVGQEATCRPALQPRSRDHVR